MSTLFRFTFFGICAAVGVAVAIGLATRAPAQAKPAAPPRVATKAAPQAEPQARAPQATMPAELQLRPSQPAVAQQSPAIAEPPLGQPPSAEEFLRWAGAVMQQTAAQGSGPPALPTLPSPLPPADVAPAAQPEPQPPKTTISKHEGEGDDRLSITIQGEDIRRVLELLSEQGGLNILPSKSVTGPVTASLKGVSIEAALDAILKSTGFVWRRDGDFIYVGTPQDFDMMQQAADRIGTRLYRPNYIRAADLQAIITPLLTPSIGTVSVTAAAEVGITSDGNSAGGDAYAGQEALLVRDYEAVLIEVDHVIQQLDCRPSQVAIEAMVLSVALDDSNEIGVDFEVLRDRTHLRIVDGSPLSDVASLDMTKGGLKIGFLDSSLSAFVNALETVGDTNVIATPRLMCLNKHRAEILIGEQLGYVSTTQTETSTTQSVEFLEVGTQLRIRPFISSDGLIRMEVHPELSTGNVRIEGGFTLPNKEVTQVTTNVMVRDGCTVIIGGLLRDELTNDTSQIPLLGSLPVIGPVFRHKSEQTERREILVLLTPRIVFDAPAAHEGDAAASEFHHRHQNFADQMMPVGKRYIGRKYFRQAQKAWAAGNRTEALRLVNLSLHFDPLSRAALDLRTDIVTGTPVGDHTAPLPGEGPALPLGAALPAEPHLPPWVLERLEARSELPLPGPQVTVEPAGPALAPVELPQ